jgi:thioredoxin reductase (NADPH)
MAELVGPLMRGALASLGIDAVTPADTGRAPVESCDLIIVGGGPAGLAAGLYAARMNLKTVLVDGGPIGGQLLNTELIEDYPGFESISGGDLASKMGDHARKFGLDIREFEPVEAVEVRPGGTKVARLESGRELHAPALVFAAGGRPRKLDVPGEAEFAGRGVSYCAVCDGAFFQAQGLAVVGGGDAALEEADFLTRYASRVTVIHRRGQLRAQPILQARARANPSIDFFLGARVREIRGNGVVSGVRLERDHEERDLPVSGVFIFVGFLPNSLLLPAQVERDAAGYVLTGRDLQTSVEGLWAVGDVRAQLTRQVATAVGDGTTAAVAVSQYLEGLRDRRRDVALSPARERASARSEA